jgi:hypothetical protein
VQRLDAAFSPRRSPDLPGQVLDAIRAVRPRQAGALESGVKPPHSKSKNNRLKLLFEALGPIIIGPLYSSTG